MTHAGWTTPVTVPHGCPVPTCRRLRHRGAPFRSTVPAGGAPYLPGAIGLDLASNHAAAPGMPSAASRRAPLLPVLCFEDDEKVEKDLNINSTFYRVLFAKALDSYVYK